LTFIPTDSIDYVICSLAIHYVKDWEPLLGELYRILKNGGVLFISTHHPFLVLDYPPFRDISYFDTTLVVDTWGKQDRPFKVRYFTRSLANMLKPIINSQFKIISIEEPPPDERCGQVSPRVYRSLSERPGFLFITLGKSG
jgi:ubiquinone/menaquinone biosynthesis C-methylase UbiE